tara:strand:- start:139 stop:378 length:240 start_codon:yes stop_codon:yes gene_type:complete
MKLLNPKREFFLNNLSERKKKISLLHRLKIMPVIRRTTNLLISEPPIYKLESQDIKNPHPTIGGSINRLKQYIEKKGIK